jgi:hypothetical protein
MLAGVSGRKAIVAVTDGVDNGSKDSAAEAIRAAQPADTVIYAIQYSGDAADRPEGRVALDRLATRRNAQPVFHRLRFRQSAS